MNHSRKAGV